MRHPAKKCICKWQFTRLHLVRYILGQHQHYFVNLFNLFRSADDDRGPGGLWEILPAAGHAWRDAGHQGKSLLEQVRHHNNTVQDTASHVMYCCGTFYSGTVDFHLEKRFFNFPHKIGGYKSLFSKVLWHLQLK